MTYSIVARDAATGALGIAVQSCTFGVGASVPWLRPGVGAVATQAFTETGYGNWCLDALARGATATEALRAASARDGASDLHQVGVVGANGTAAAFTGERCVAHAGHLVDNGFVVLANMTASAQVWPAMADAYHAAHGSFAQRLLAALHAAQHLGGDARGVESAALVIVDGVRTDAAAPLLDVRVDRSDDPLGELAKLLRAAGAYARYERAIGELFRGNADTALALADDGLRALPGDPNLRFVRASALLACGEIDAGRAELRALIAERPSWEVVIRGFAANGLLPISSAIALDALLGHPRLEMRAISGTPPSPA